MSNLTHIDAQGNAVMVDVTGKEETDRVAKAKGSVLMQAGTLHAITGAKIKKGDVLSIAQLAGIMGAKRTSDLIPLCHPLALTSSKVELTVDTGRNAVDITATCKITGKTGVEMEALTAVSVAALTIYDMCKAIDRGMQITNIRLIQKSGGKSGKFDAT
jgi:cyclic pyranopterin phosphate synthase